jgi:hypothetical protein
MPFQRAADFQDFVSAAAVGWLAIFMGLLSGSGYESVSDAHLGI